MATKTAELNEAEFRPLLDAEAAFLSHYSIGFVTPTGSSDYGVGGSGTLVAIDNTRGILTASHVASYLQDQNNDVGLVLPIPGRAHRPHLPISLCRIVALGPGRAENSGPDLALIIPPLDVVGSLAARQSFYNLSSHQDAMLGQPQPIELGWWLLSGFAYEWTTDLPPEAGFLRLKSFRGIHGLGLVERQYDVDDHDYFVYEALYNDQYEGPDEYGGFSGGGLWQLLARQIDGKVVITDRLLSGVAFFQSNKTGDDAPTREILCHGTTSIYGRLIEAVREATR